MKHIFFVIISMGLCSFGKLQAQTCTCTISQVLNNTVMPCTLTVGTVVTVNSETALRNAINQANASGGNMTILIENGTYQIASVYWYPYITASNVVFRSVSGNRDSVIIRGGGMADVSPGSESGFLIAGDHVVIADLTIKEVGNHGIQVSGHHLFVHNVRIQNTYQQMIKGATSAASIDSAVVQCCLLEYPAGTGPQYYIGGLDIHKGRGWIVCDNVIRNIVSPSGSAAEHGIHFWDHSAGNVVERNLIVNCDRGIGFGLGGSPNDGGIIRNNMIYNNGAGLFDDVGIGLETSPDTKILNNTVYIEYANAIEYRFAATQNAEIINNLTKTLITSRDGGGASLATNLTGAQPSWFVNTTAGDLRLAASIPSVVDQGTALLLMVEDDIDKTLRPQGSAYDIGAHEYVLPAYCHFAPTMNGFALYPNPSKGQLIVGSAYQNAELRIFSVDGRQVFSAAVNCGKTDIDMSMHTSGIYIYTFIVKNEAAARGIIILE